MRQSARTEPKDAPFLAIDWLVRIAHRVQLARNLMLFLTLYLTWDSYQWAKGFALVSSRSGLEVVGIMGAVLGGVTALQGWVFGNYLKHRPDELTKG